jgi:uracil-DNA glycosylase
MTGLTSLLADVRQCRICEKMLPCEPRPVLQCSGQSKILIASQAPGRKVQQSGIPFDDASGKRLREWLDIDTDTFYDASQIAILPMGFCYPGSGKSGDLPPRPECEPAWRSSLLEQMQKVEVTLVLGQFAQRYHFINGPKTLTELVKSWRDYWPILVPLPHPSPRNIRWFMQNPWFEQELLPELKILIKNLLSR